ncbi:MAG: alanine--tRNA ligase [Candidatus Lloydbacteria bacterium]|nr:alanine--tRNA ligase [Candidatus Lloydbacteria bacterium]
MRSEETRKRFLEFFKVRGHAIIPSASLVPENDPSVLFTTAGMQPLVPYLLGEPHPAGKRLANVQKCVRTQDIDEVGDATHDTFFEMLGNWSLGDPTAPDGIGEAGYFKEETITWSYEFLTSKEEGLGLDPSRLFITVFGGNNSVKEVDEESKKIWMSLGIPEHRIYIMEGDSNWWSPGDNGPCGPDTEMFYDVTEKGLGDLTKEAFKQADQEQKAVEIWNDVFMEYEKKDGRIIGKLKNKNVDTGAGLERLAMVMQGKDNIFDTDLFKPLMNAIDMRAASQDLRAKRIVADHIRTAVFMIADGVLPSNTDRGYILRRLIRRAVRYVDVLKMKEGALAALSDIVVLKYENVYKNLSSEKERIGKTIADESAKFRKTLEQGLRELHKLAYPNLQRFNDGEPIPKLEVITNRGSGEKLFNIFSTYGFPLELSLEEIERLRVYYKFSALTEEIKNRVIEEFQKSFEKHQALSRAGAEQKFKGGLSGHGEMETKYHTATHLLHQALRMVLGEHVVQKGSNITPERLRFDFSHSEKLTDEQKKKVEDIVNEQIKRALPVSYEELPIEEARARGAIGAFGDKYGERVKVYTIGDEKTGIFSAEFCGGPHVKNTQELGYFKITKEEAVAQGIRRIKAALD